MGPHSISTFSARVLSLQRERKRALRPGAGLSYSNTEDAREILHFGFRAMLSYGKRKRNQIYVPYLPFKILEQPAFMCKRLILALLSPGAS